ncbi:hypothetical protein M0534_06580 [Methylonatrum kenyense]|uniref:hypothetical protein n=1 Tax=Methylonatrum kenyense TaxID=455253 RepID=UPI0020C08BD8|nr:hypothetical protein [Methylonatrum kenyense]MCK8515990.1 hypothetical protein [Methylonatrum kenyense]
MKSRCSRLNGFLLPPLDWLVPNWSQAVMLDHFQSDSGEYRGPVFLALTGHDAVGLIRNGPVDEPGAVAIVTRFPLAAGIRVASGKGEVRPATAAEQAAAMRACSSGSVSRLDPTWLFGQLGFCLHGEPWLISVFQFRDGDCVASCSSTVDQRIVPLAEE